MKIWLIIFCIFILLSASITAIPINKSINKTIKKEGLQDMTSSSWGNYIKGRSNTTAPLFIVSMSDKKEFYKRIMQLNIENMQKINDKNKKIGKVKSVAANESWAREWKNNREVFLISKDKLTTIKSELKMD